MKNFSLTNANQRKVVLCFLFINLMTSLSGFSQNVGINSNGNPPNTSAGLDIDFPDKGLLIPRVGLTSSSSFAPLSAHVAGMVVYNTATAGDVIPGFYYNDGSKWNAGLPSGNAIGDMLYWNGTSWNLLPVGTSGQYLTLNASNIPFWASGSGGGGVYATLTTNTASIITGISATSGGNITSDGGLAVLSRGVCWKTTTGPTIADNKTVDGSGIGAFTSSLIGLLPVTTYYVRAYATNSSSTTYGNEISFTTTAVLPTLAATTGASAITGNTATTGGNVTNTGGATITERGVCYATTANPTISNLKVIDPAPGAGVFTSNLTGLVGYTTYYVRAYATNSIGTAYGTQISFTTLRIPPTLVTIAASNIMSTTATSGGSMNWNGGGYSNYQNYGVCYSTTPVTTLPVYIETSSPNYARIATNTTNGSVNINTPIGPWVTNLTGLSSNTTYYIRSYLNLYTGSGWVTVYGPELSFTTALIQTSPMGAVTGTTAVSGGTIGAGATITARGVCYGTSTGPTLANSFTSDGSGTGTYVSNISGLTNAVTYYVRAYCTDNLDNTTYGNEYSFTTGTPKTIGQDLAGGKVIYVDATGQHGLIGALVDQGSGVRWGTCGGLNLGMAQGAGAIYAGLNNTNVIVANCGAGTAAQLCAAYTAGGTNLPGITNWYLPSHDELQILVDQKAIINLTVTPSYYGAGVLYWASTEYNASIGYAHYSLNGIYDYNVSKSATYYGTTTNLMYVRAVRAF